MTPDTDMHDLILARVFNAPREKVWEAWTKAEQLKKWWGPIGFTVPEVASDFRKGGSYLYCLRSPGGQKIYITGVFKEIIPPEKLAFTGSFADEHGNVVPGSRYGMDGHEQGMQTVEFEAIGEVTKITLRQGGLPPEERDNEGKLWSQSFDKLARVLE